MTAVSLIVALSCVALLIATGVLGDRCLATAAWPTQAPRLALRLWRTWSATTLASLFVLMLLPAHDVVEKFLLVALRAEKHDVHFAYATDAVVHRGWNLTALGLPLLVVLRFAVLRRARRREHAARARAASAITGTTRISGTLVHVDPRPALAAYCLPGQRSSRRQTGRDPMIIVSAGTRQRLNPSQLAACIHHEKAHLDRRHHHLVRQAQATTLLLSRVGLLRNYATQVARLVELDADDDAARHTSRRHVAECLVLMSEGSSPRPKPGLAAAGANALERVQRLASPPARHGVRSTSGLPLGVLPLVPLMLLVGPGVLASAGHGHWY